MSRDQTAAPMTRRERQRADMMQELLQVSRQVLVEHAEGLSIRAVAAGMGMTAPALYRYVDSHAALVELVVAQIMSELSELIRAASAPHLPDDPGLALVMGTVAFRRWALALPREFSLAFADPNQTTAVAPEDGTGLHSLAEAFAPLYRQVCERYQVEPASAGQHVIDCLPGEESEWGMPAQHKWHFLNLWLRLYGVVTLEVFRQVPPGMIERGVFFLETLRQLGAQLNMAEDADRILASAGQDLGLALPSGEL